MENLVAPGFDPSGVGARIQGIYRRADYLDRMGRFAETIHKAGGVCTSQVVIQGACPMDTLRSCPVLSSILCRTP